MNKTTTYFIEDSSLNRLNFELDADKAVSVNLTDGFMEFTDIKDLISQLRFVADELEKGIV